MSEIEYCCHCDEPTGQAGECEDSFYLENGEGPFCRRCWDFSSKIAKLQARVRELEENGMELSARCCVAKEGEGLICGNWGPECVKDRKIRELEAENERLVRQIDDLEEQNLFNIPLI